MKAIVLNCTLKKSPDQSNTALLAGEVISGLEERGVECDTLRLVDMNVLPGVSSDEGNGDEWPGVREKILARARLKRRAAGAGADGRDALRAERGGADDSLQPRRRLRRDRKRGRRQELHLRDGVSDGRGRLHRPAARLDVLEHGTWAPAPSTPTPTTAKSGPAPPPAPAHTTSSTSPGLCMRTPYPPSNRRAQTGPIRGGNA